MESVTSLDLHPPEAVLVVAGEFDAAASIELRGRLEDAVRVGCVSFEVDASGVTFVDATALDTLVWLRNLAVPLGGDVVVTAASENFRWSASVAHLGDAFGLGRLPAGNETPDPPTPR